MRYIILIITVLICNRTTFAIDIYKCIDREGVTHFSAEPILACENQQESIVLDEVPISPESNEYSIENQLERMEKRKLREQQQERARLQEELLREQIRAAKRQAAKDHEEKNDEPPRPVTYLPIYVPPRHSHFPGRKRPPPGDSRDPKAALPYGRNKDERGVSIQVDIK